MHTHTHTQYTHTQSPGTRYGESVTEFQSTSIVQISRNGQSSAARVTLCSLCGFCCSIVEMNGQSKSRCKLVVVVFFCSIVEMSGQRTMLIVWFLLQ